MMLKVRKVDPLNPDNSIIREASDYIKNGYLVAFPHGDCLWAGRRYI